MKRLLRWLPVVVVPALFLAALAAIAHELELHHPQEIADALDNLSPGSLAWATVLTVASYGVLTLYDWFGLRYAGRTLNYGRVALASFTAYVFSYNIGVSVLGGAAVRYRLYSNWGLSGIEVGKVVLFCASTFWLGMATVAGTVMLVGALPVGIAAVPPWAVALCGGVLLVLAAGYVAAGFLVKRPLRVRDWQLSLPTPSLALVQLGLSVLDLTLAGTVLFALFPGHDVAFPTFLGVYLVAVAAGLISHVPGGLGVFESVILLALPTAAPNPELVAMLVAFRAIYYLFPFSVGLAIVAGEAALRARGRLAGYAGTLSKGVAVVAPRVLTFTTFLGGVILLASGATPADGTRLEWLGRFLPVSVVETSHFLASLAGAALLLLARGLQLRLNAAWVLALGMLGVGAVLSLVKGFDFEEAIALTAMAAALAASRGHFRRRSSLWDHRFSPGWLLAIVLVLAGTTWLGFFAYKHVEYSHELWWSFELAGDAPRFLRASVGIAAVVAIVGLARLLRPAGHLKKVVDEEELSRAVRIAAASQSSGANLVALGDKHLLWSDSGRSFIMYGVTGRSWVALGDPVGEDAEAEELVWRFRERCDQAGAWPVFYEVSAECLPLYLDLGLSLFKLGEEARVPLTGFSLEGGTRKGLRTTRGRLERDGAAFALWEPPEVQARMEELRAVSDAWLAGRATREKGFSLGFFAPEYVGRFPAAVVLHRGKVAAFATVWRSGGKEELSVDLMRQTREAPPSTMEYLFIRLLLAGAAEGYRWFNLGMAPFSGIEHHPLAPLWNRMGALLFRQGEHFYNFQGLRRYKEKFDPVWRPRYLASPGGLILPRVLASVGSLVSGGLAGIIRK
jgi:phosphatidylglycerol lysyltransferase